MTNADPNLSRAQRNTLRRMVTACRQLLEDEIARLLEGQYGIHRSGRVEPRNALRQLTSTDLAYRTQVLAYLRHIEAALPGLEQRNARKPDDERVPANVIEHLIREVAFTHLNRLCAFKMMEHPERRLIRETVGRGWQSNGFLFYLADHPEDEEHYRSGRQDVAYRHFLAWQSTELSHELGALFSPLDLAQHLFPSQRVLDALLEQINSDEQAAVWVVPETIGWIYQYFTPRELRERARKESQAPRNAYELAFRNQFYTPAYVVAFLADNTLGRIWYEMRHGETALVEQCASLICRPGELFLAEGDVIPEMVENSANVILFRQKCDPRELRVLDPACGSGHFLIYCYGLLETIYREAYDDPDLGRALQHEFPIRTQFEQQIPALILAHNLHGIDIDLRAVQIASLALWLRAHSGPLAVRSTRGAHVPITRTNIVCAEPMPGDVALLDAFVADIQPPVLGQLLKTVFHAMQLAGEVGSLLNIQDGLRQAIAVAKQQWATSNDEQANLFGDVPPTQLGIFDVRNMSDAAFWSEAEERVLKHLQAYAEHLAGDDDRRRLFVDNAVQGFAFIDVCQRSYDVVLMNPPFGAPSRGSVAYIAKQYERTKNDLYAAFVERGLQLLRPGGLLGAITSRTGFFLSSFQKWRDEVLLKTARPIIVADLGYGVLDTAMVETAAYVLEVV